MIAGGWLLWIRLIGTPLDEQIMDTDRASLFAALNNLLFGLGLALFVIGLFALFPPAGAAALVTAEGLVISGGAAISIPAATTAILGTATIAYAEATRDGGDTGPPGQASSASKPADGSGRSTQTGDALGGNRTASGIENWAREQGWHRTKTPNGPIKYVDENGVTRVTLKKGSARAPGSDSPHVEIRNAEGQRIDPAGSPVTRKSAGNHTPITWDLP